MKEILFITLSLLFIGFTQRKVINYLIEQSKQCAIEPWDFQVHVKVNPEKRKPFRIRHSKGF